MSNLNDLSERDFAQVRKLIYGRVGIKLGDSKRAMVVSRLARRLRDLKLQTFPEYLQQLEDPGAQEWQFFTNALTTNLTSFFREPHHFDTLAAALKAARGRSEFHIWCSAASTGEEPYSIAMVVNEVGKAGPRKVEILASDVDTNVLQRGAQGVYAMERIEQLSAARKHRFFLKGEGPKAGYCKVKPVLQRNLNFAQINLLDARWPVPPKVDVIFCRNVMIYFDKDTQRRLVQHFCEHMHAESLFISGHSESLYHCSDFLSPMGRTVYRRAGS